MHLSTWTDNWVDLPLNEDLYYEIAGTDRTIFRSENGQGDRAGGYEQDVWNLLNHNQEARGMDRSNGMLYAPVGKAQPVQARRVYFCRYVAGAWTYIRYV